jgi:hypothetical protein
MKKIKHKKRKKKKEKRNSYSILEIILKALVVSSSKFQQILTKNATFVILAT